MKKIIALIIVTSVLIYALPSFVPSSASWRIDRHVGTPMAQSSGWEEMSNFKDPFGNPQWGQGSCTAPGGECHRNDWITWWYPSMVSEPDVEEGYTPYYPETFPIGYDGVLGEYIF